MNKLLMIGLSAALLAACQTTTPVDVSADASGSQIATQSDLAPVIGRTINFDEGQSFTLSNAGGLRGTWDGQPLVGSYVMRDGFFCRTLSQGPRGTSPEDCQLWVINGDTIAVTRDRGNGGAFTYSLS